MSLPVVTFNNPLPDVRPLDRKQDGRPMWRLTAPFVYRVNGRPDTVPAGFEFDFASVPRGLWNLCPPYDPAYAAAALVHDWLYRIHGYKRGFCDKIFLAAMVFRSVPWWQRETMYAAVKWCGGRAYRKNRDEDVMTDRALAGIFSPVMPLWDEAGELREA